MVENPQKPRAWLAGRRAFCGAEARQPAICALHRSILESVDARHLAGTTHTGPRRAKTLLLDSRADATGAEVIAPAACVFTLAGVGKEGRLLGGPAAPTRLLFSLAYATVVGILMKSTDLPG